MTFHVHLLCQINDQTECENSRLILTVSTDSLPQYGYSWWPDSAVLVWPEPWNLEYG